MTSSRVPCEICGGPSHHTHHRKRRSQGGDNSPANLMRLCWTDHSAIHQNPSETFKKGYLVHSWEDPAQVPIEKPQDHEHEGKCDKCGVQITTKLKRKTFKGEEKRNRRTWTIRVPNDEKEDGMGLLKDGLSQLEEALGYDPARPPYNTIMDAVNLALLHGVS